jgi:anti-anti-sigma factor
MAAAESLRVGGAGSPDSEVLVATPSVSTRMFTHTVVVKLRGVVDERDTPRLRRVLVDLIMRRRPRQLVVDLTRATTVDPLAIGTLVAAHDAAPDMRVAFAVRRPNPSVAAQLVRAGLGPLPSRRK